MKFPARIEAKSTVMMGKPCVKGTRIPVVGQFGFKLTHYPNSCLPRTGEDSGRRDLRPIAHRLSTARR